MTLLNVTILVLILIIVVPFLVWLYARIVSKAYFKSLQEFIRSTKLQRKEH